MFERKPKPNFADFRAGIWSSLKAGTISSPGANQRHMKTAMYERLEREECWEREQEQARRKAIKAQKLAAYELTFGDGETMKSRGWEHAVHATLEDGTPVTVSFGTGKNQGHYLLAEGHLTADEFMTKKMHDHYRGTDLPPILRGFS